VEKKEEKRDTECCPGLVSSWKVRVLNGMGSGVTFVVEAPDEPKQT
jgi:hypothetical protein